MRSIERRRVGSPRTPMTPAAPAVRDAGGVETGSSPRGVDRASLAALDVALASAAAAIPLVGAHQQPGGLARRPAAIAPSTPMARLAIPTSC